MIEPVKQASMTVRVDTQVSLTELEAHLARHGLSLGPLSPGALGLTLAAFLEGPYAGLRCVAGGRLEPLCASLRVVLTSGENFETNGAPRSAAGPDLTALVLGGEGRLARATHATVRCEPYTRSQLRATRVELADARALVEFLQQQLADGAHLWSVNAHGGSALIHHHGVLRIPMDVAPQVARPDVAPASHVAHSDVASASHVARSDVVGAGQAPPALHATPGGASPSPTATELECTWDAVESALQAGHAIDLFRLSLSTVIARGEVEGLALHTRTPWHTVSTLLEGGPPSAP